MNIEKLIILAIILAILTLGESKPEIVLINKGFSQYNVTNLSDFDDNLNATFAQLRDELNGGKYFATAEQPRGSNSAYAMVQCRKYLSSADCIACFTAAESLIRKFPPANGARLMYLGCFLRYESSKFFDQSTQEGRVASCGNQTASDATAFEIALSGLLADLQVATPKINGFFAANKRAIGESSSLEVYAIAQCVESINESGCRECLQVANGNVKTTRCLTSTAGWALDVGCFLRYSSTPFFADNQTTDITPFLKTGKPPNSLFTTLYLKCT
ncbi:hypothetical protein Pint_28600 [Pistacia integerrima]|uniref:Uncharacterized protein n=1 Tax=Pistacia integerrima TaxID=434235 RepID=A0ACC0YNV6_9ROSI|nr:hypothetical protein Pint_28600 [Pistacia integerrima]